MNTLLLPCDKPHGLILLFLGWGIGFTPFLTLRKPGYDILLVKDYLDFSPENLELHVRTLRENRFHDTGIEYAETVVVAWSFGVRMADDFLKYTKQNITLTLAVNGTLPHIDSRKGIPPEIFNGTLEYLSVSTLNKFRLRCVGNGAKYKSIFPVDLQDDIDQLKAELSWFAKIAPSFGTIRWDKVIIGMEDRIFPPDNQFRAWENNDVYPMEGMAHFPDFSRIITEFIADKQRVADKFGCTRGNYTRNADAQKQTAQMLHKYLMDFAGEKFERSPERVTVLEAGHGDGTFTRQYFESLHPSIRKIILTDISVDAFLPWNDARFLKKQDTEYQSIVCDVESEQFAAEYLRKESYDLILSASMLQWLNSPSMFLRKCCRALKPGGTIAIAYYGEGTLRELVSAGGNGLKYPSIRRMVQIAVDSGMDMQLAENQEIILDFDLPMDALRHLKLTGVNALPKDSSPADTRRIIRHWPLNQSGKANLTFSPVYLILNKKI